MTTTIKLLTTLPVCINPSNAGHHLLGEAGVLIGGPHHHLAVLPLGDGQGGLGLQVELLLRPWGGNL